MPGHTEEASQRKAAKVAGLMFLFIVIGWTLNWTLVDSKLTVAGNVTATVNNIMANELLFRIGITNQLIFSISGVVLALALYIILKPVNKNLALLALFLKLMEAIIGAVIALCSFMALLILNGQASLTAFEQEYIQALVGLFLNGRISISAIPMVFLGLNLMVFFYILFKSKYVPRILAGFGILSYALIFMYALITILSPNYAAIMIIQIICWAPSVLFELIIGLWLLFKGVNVQQRDVKNE